MAAGYNYSIAFASVLMCVCTSTRSRVADTTCAMHLQWTVLARQSYIHTMMSVIVYVCPHSANAVDCVGKTEPQSKITSVFIYVCYSQRQETHM